MNPQPGAAGAKDGVETKIPALDFLQPTFLRYLYVFVLYLHKLLRLSAPTTSNTPPLGLIHGKCKINQNKIYVISAMQAHCPRLRK